MRVPVHISVNTIRRLKQVQTLLDQLDPEAAPKALVIPGSPVPHGGIIVFPGSFNPPTTAHLALLKQARQFASLHAPMQVYAAMSKRTTDKENVERPLLVDRVVLLDTVLRRRLPGTGILLFNRGLYVEQAQAVRTSFPQLTRLLFLVGFDKIVQILDPRYYEDRDAALEDLFALAELLVAPRGDAGPEELDELLNRPENRPFARHISALPFSAAYRDISSSQIRQHPGAHRADLLLEVRRFMSDTRAYAPPVRLSNEIDYYGERVKILEALLKNAKVGR